MVRRTGNLVRVKVQFSSLKEETCPTEQKVSLENKFPKVSESCHLNFQSSQSPLLSSSQRQRQVSVEKHTCQIVNDDQQTSDKPEKHSFYKQKASGSGSGSPSSFINFLDTTI